MNTNDTKRLCHRRNADECIKSQRDHVSLRTIFANCKLNCLRYVDTIFYLASLKLETLPNLNTPRGHLDISLLTLYGRNRRRAFAV